MLTGFGLGLVIAPISTTAINTANKHQLGMASSVCNSVAYDRHDLRLAALTSWDWAAFVHK